MTRARVETCHPEAQPKDLGIGQAGFSRSQARSFTTLRSVQDDITRAIVNPTSYEKVGFAKVNLPRFCGNGVTKPDGPGLNVVDSQAEGAILPVRMMEPDLNDIPVEV